MPKFNKRNTKRIDPRYFLSETTDRSEGFADDTDGDGTDDASELEAIAAKLRGDDDASAPSGGKHDRGIERMLDRITGEGAHSGADKDHEYGGRRDELRQTLKNVLNDPMHGWDKWHPVEFSGDEEDYPMLMAVLIRKGDALAKKSGSGDKLDLPVDEFALHTWLRKKLGYSANLQKHRWVHKDEDLIGEGELRTASGTIRSGAAELADKIGRGALDFAARHPMAKAASKAAGKLKPAHDATKKSVASLKRDLGILKGEYSKFFKQHKTLKKVIDSNPNTVVAKKAVQQSKKLTGEIKGLRKRIEQVMADLSALE